uniref:Iap-5 n=1 Tax=Cryptophlebia leucotreta granulosis virus TaxID=35254 RepID=A0A2H4ZKB6_GVCL|nr:iap-5 [Cryptophlebia leucotreta granulovirus]
MDVYENRLDSFKYWPGHENKEKLALVGFYFSGVGDRIVCYFCKLDLYNFCVGEEDSIRDHKRYSPNCPFLTNNINPNYINTRFMSPRSVTSNYPLLTAHKGDYSLLEHRINSYLNFPSCLKSLVSDLALNGFYYTNFGDAVCCYACLIVAKDWTTNSNVKSIHSKLNSRCPLLHLISFNHNNNERNIDIKYQYTTPSAPIPDDNHYAIPKCLKCKQKFIDAVLLPCYHFCLCQECAITSSECVACNVYTGGFFLVKIPFNKLNLVEHEQIPDRI